ncbi:hypothetical protein BO94DRAFT_470351 [Aspergillus sclerotioniger CBS 115572]|uniref:RING-type domain-containing protein n=1 Tax=Aspergillus sclerotioniger CBS 115572 TaxID=1450535 RepID=A0A317W6F4_9EURO|nr:hypothetical protein BO94DRAFT_470351 [Aspergillus sclerotioniger CBS 115572]PWY80892.1 hypothetical protein BO94DRAFT_470351 [Aspergillus sclerotioniger CBS 115572]
MASSPLPQLTDILKIYPAADHHCFGNSNYYNRRCNNLTSHHNRQEALWLLEQGTRQLAATSLASLDNILNQLAPLLLCSHQHRDQAARLVAQWKEKLQRYIDGRSAAAAPATMNNRVLHIPGNSVLTTGGGLAFSNLTTTHGSASSSMLVLPHGMVETGPSPIYGHRQGPRVEMSRPTVNATSASATATSARAASSHAHPHNVHPQNDHPHNAHAHHPHPRMSSIHPVSATLMTPAQVYPQQPGPQSGSGSTMVNCPVPKPPAKRSVKPRPVDGDCGICLLPYFDESIKYDSSEDEEMEDADDEEEAWEEMDGDAELSGPDYDHELLVWCRAFCGTNYHRACMEKWIETFEVHEPTCPTCRNYWIY